MRGMSGPRVTALLLAAASAAVLAGCGGATPASGLASGAQVAAATTSASTSTSASTASPDSSGPVLDPSQGAGTGQGAVPVRLQIPSIGVDTPVMRLGLAPDQTVQVPPIEAHSPAGWYEGSAAPGDAGASVLLAHVTVGRFGDGVFVHLSRLKQGDRVVVGLASGRTVAFTVDSVQTVAKADFPSQAVYGKTDRPVLRLVTCGGPRDPAGDGYLDNVVVYASLAAA